MNMRRLMVVARDEFALTLRRPMVWTLLALLLLLTWGIAAGGVQVALGSGDASVGGKKAFLTSQFAVTQIMTVFTFTIYTFFAASAAGLSVIRDDEARALEVLQATPLRPTEYAWGKYAGVTAAFLVVLAMHLVLLVLFLSVIPNADMLETRGPFALGNYLIPALTVATPFIFFTTGISFGVGTGTRRAILVFVAPIALLMLSAFFLWSWSPSWLSESWNRVLMFADPAAARWLRETYLKVDRGADFYNTQPVGFDALFAANRLFWLAVGLGTAWLGVRRFARTARASHAVSAAQVSAALAIPSAASLATPGVSASLASLQVTGAPLGAWATAWGAASAEARELASRAGLYLFVPLIVLQLVGSSLVAIGAFDTPLLLTPGQLAASQLQTMAVWITLLLVFYGVESMERERTTRLDAIHDTLPINTGAFLLGKLMALGVVWLVVAVAAVLASAVIILVQRKVPFSLAPFALLWGLLFLPTFLAFATFVFAAWTLVRNRYSTYAIALAVLGVTAWAMITGRMSWLYNWSLWTGVRWSDIGTLQFDRQALVLNRLLWLSLAVAFWRLATRWYPRTARDTVSLVHAWSGRQILRSLRRAAPYLVAPVLLGATLFRTMNQGPDGNRAEKTAKDYWKKNLATWRDAPFPWLKDVDIDITIEPEARRYRVAGSYLIKNHRDTTLRQIPLTVGMWKQMRWTANGDSIVPDTASHLYLFRLRHPLGAGDSVRIGFAYEGDVSAPTKGKGSGGAGEFIIPSGVVMTSFGPRWFPYLGYEPGIGSDKDNAFEPRQYPDDWFSGVTPALFGSQLPMTVRTRLTVPADFTANGVGELVADSVHGATRTVVWKTDQPVMAFNVIAGRYDVKRGAGTAIFYHRAHTYNIDEMLSAMNAARQWYGEWFGAYPWKLLKISEFPALAGYAQGFPTNISFSEEIGFLTKSEPRTNLAFMVSAHEIAHQWWGNMLQPGGGPGSNLLSEGMAHFSTMLLMEHEKGERAGLELRKRFESRWGDGRSADAERKLYRIDGSKDGDGVVTYEKAGWTFWMLADRMGRDNALRGMKEFIAKFRGTEDHAALEDLTAHLRAYAPDTASYNDFVRQWFDTVSVLEYKVEGATTRRFAAGGEWETQAVVKNAGNARMPVDIGVVKGERFPDDTTRRATTPYAQALTRVTLGAGERMTVTVRSPFEPEKVVIDPDVRVLQLRRKLAERKVDRP